MRKTYILGVLFALIVASSSPVFSESKSKKLQRECIEPTVNIDSPFSTYGTGVVIRSERMPSGKYLNLVLTCHHVIHPVPLRLRYYLFNDEEPVTWSPRYRGMVYAKSEERDMAVMFFISSNKLAAASLDLDTNPKRGDNLWTIGTAFLTIPPRVGEGKVHHFDGNDIVGSASLAFGDSGGPTFMFKNGHYRIIGINSACAIINNTVMSFIANYKSIKNLTSWNTEENEALKFVIDRKEKMPELPGIFLKVCEINDPESK